MSQIERRRAKRREILESFSFFVSVPKKGPTRLAVHDISDLGLRFDLDADGEPEGMMPVKVGDALQVRLYLNSSLSLPLRVKVARVENKNGRRIIGAEIGDQELVAQQALTSLLQLIDQLGGLAEVDPVSY